MLGCDWWYSLNFNVVSVHAEDWNKSCERNLNAEADTEVHWNFMRANNYCFKHTQLSTFLFKVRNCGSCFSSSSRCFQTFKKTLSFHLSFNFCFTNSKPIENMRAFPYFQIITRNVFDNLCFFRNHFYLHTTLDTVALIFLFPFNCTSKLNMKHCRCFVTFPHSNWFIHHLLSADINFNYHNFHKFAQS